MEQTEQTKLKLNNNCLILVLLPDMIILGKRLVADVREYLLVFTDNNISWSTRFSQYELWELRCQINSCTKSTVQKPVCNQPGCEWFNHIKGPNISGRIMNDSTQLLDLILIKNSTPKLSEDKHITHLISVMGFISTVLLLVKLWRVQTKTAII